MDAAFNDEPMDVAADGSHAEPIDNDDFGVQPLPPDDENNPMDQGDEEPVVAPQADEPSNIVLTPLPDPDLERQRGQRRGKVIDDVKILEKKYMQIRLGNVRIATKVKINNSFIGI